MTWIATHLPFTGICGSLHSLQRRLAVSSTGTRQSFQASMDRLTNRHKSPRNTHRTTAGALQPTHELRREFRAGDHTSDMNGHRDLASGCFGCINFSRAVESTCHFDPEINIHRCSALGGMMIQEDVMPVGAKAWLTSQKLPNLIQGRAPCRANRTNRNSASDSGQFSCRHTFDRYDGGDVFNLVTLTDDLQRAFDLVTYTVLDLVVRRSEGESKRGQS